MKLSVMRPALVLALALGLASCGGKEGYTVGGTVSGLEYSGLVLTSNGMETAVAAKATSFALPGELSYGDVYDVTVKTQPLHQTCGPTSGTGANTAGRLATINVLIQCITNTYTVGGTISGLTVDGLVLANGSTGGTLSPLKDTTSFVFGIPVAYGQSYGITVQTQPAGLTCSVANGTGLMGDAKVENVAVSCVPNT